MEILLATNIFDSKSYSHIIAYIMKNTNKMEWLKYIPVNEENCEELTHNYSLFKNVHQINSKYIVTDNLVNIYQVYQLVDYITNEYIEYLQDFEENFEENVENMTNEIYELWFKKKNQCDLMSHEQYEIWFDYVRLSHFDDFEDLIQYEYSPEDSEFFIEYLKKYDLEHFIPEISEDSNEMLLNTLQVVKSKFSTNRYIKKIKTMERFIHMNIKMEI